MPGVTFLKIPLANLTARSRPRAACPAGDVASFGLRFEAMACADIMERKSRLHESEGLGDADYIAGWLAGRAGDYVDI